jgi:hypothetical protein
VTPDRKLRRTVEQMPVFQAIDPTRAAGECRPVSKESRSMRKTILSLSSAGALALSLLLSGCGGGGDDDGLEGTWRLTSASINGQASVCPGANCGEQTYRFSGDDTYEVHTFQNGNRFFTSGTWLQNEANGTLTLTATRSGSDTDGDGTVEASEIQNVAGNPITVGLQVDEEQMRITEPNGNIFQFQRQ